MAVSPEGFRTVLSHLAAGVVIVTTRDSEGEPHGMTATAVCSVSLEPPLVMVCLSHDAATHTAVAQSGIFALNLLSASGETMARHFATQSGEKFAELSLESSETGAPVLEGALAYCDCSVVRSVSAGDHTIFIGRVMAADVGEDVGGDHSMGPLLYYRGRYGAIGIGADKDGRDRQ
jgi:flavin reductase (DIM6/NTAB) family NADH-FMN oxidoreductase RutF